MVIILAIDIFHRTANTCVIASADAIYVGITAIVTVVAVSVDVESIAGGTVSAAVLLLLIVEVIFLIETGTHVGVLRLRCEANVVDRHCPLRHSGAPRIRSALVFLYAGGVY